MGFAQKVEHGRYSGRARHHAVFVQSGGDGSLVEQPLERERFARLK